LTRRIKSNFQPNFYATFKKADRNPELFGFYPPLLLLKAINWRIKRPRSGILSVGACRCRLVFRKAVFRQAVQEVYGNGNADQSGNKIRQRLGRFDAGQAPEMGQDQNKRNKKTCTCTNNAVRKE